MADRQPPRARPTPPASPGQVTLVAADQVEGLATGHVEQVHDLVVRRGCPAASAVEVVATSLLELVDTVAEQPPPLDLALGRWFARASARAEAEPPIPVQPADCAELPDPLLRGLAALDPRALAALLARDRYDLSMAATGAAVGTDPAGAAATVADARLQVFQAVTGRSTTDLAGHPPSRVADPAVLGRYVDGAADPAESIAVRRHLAGCPDCDDVVTAQETVRRMVAALPLVPLDDTARAEAIDAALGRAAHALPRTVDVVAFDGTPADQERDDAPTAGLAVLAVTLIVLAAMAGLLAGALAAH